MQRHLMPNVPPSARAFVILVSLGLSLLSLIVSHLVIYAALAHGIHSLERLLAIGAIAGALPAFIVLRRYGRLSAGRSMGASVGGVLLSLSHFYVGTMLGIILMLSGVLVVVRNVSAGPERA